MKKTIKEYSSIGLIHADEDIPISELIARLKGFAEKVGYETKINISSFWGDVDDPNVCLLHEREETDEEYEKRMKVREYQKQQILKGLESLEKEKQQRLNELKQIEEEMAPTLLKAENA